MNERYVRLARQQGTNLCRWYLGIENMCDKLCGPAPGGVHFLNSRCYSHKGRTMMSVFKNMLCAQNHARTNVVLINDSIYSWSTIKIHQTTYIIYYVHRRKRNKHKTLVFFLHGPIPTTLFFESREDKTNNNITYPLNGVLVPRPSNLATM